MAQSFKSELEEMGLVVKHGGKHWKVYTQDGRWVMDFSGSPSDLRWRKNATRRLVHKLEMIYGERSGRV